MPSFSSLIDEKQPLNDSKPLICPQFDEISPIESTPLPKTMVIENPSTDSAKSDEMLGESISKTLELIPEITQFENPISSVESPNELLQNGVGKDEEVLLSEAQEECNKIENETIDDIFGDENLFLSCDDYDNINDDDYDISVVPKRSNFSKANCIEEETECSQFYGPKALNREDGIGDREPGLFSFRSSGWSEPEPCPVGAGLSNLGNTCFLNVIIQCFTHTVPLVEGFLSLKHDASSHGKDEFCVICAVRDQIEQSLEFSGKIVSPSNLVDNLNYISSSFHRYQQEDAHEFLQCLFDKLDTNWSKHESKSGKLPSSHDSLVKQVFGGCLVSQLCCSKCSFVSESYEPMIDLSLEIGDIDDLESAFKSFTKVENLEDTATCDKCKEKVQREKQLLLDQAPQVASLHLKRFKSDGIHVEKIDKMVKYPLELDLVPFTKGARDDNEELKYELCGFVVHVGSSSTSGHYYCYIRSSPDSWYCFDDKKVTKVSEETALEQEAYILFYARKGTPWFSGLLDTWKTRLEEKSNTSPKSVLDNQACYRRDAPSVTYAEPISYRRLAKVEPTPSTCLSYDEARNDEPRKTCVETPSISNVQNHFATGFKYDMSAESASLDVFAYDSDEEPEPVAEMKFKIPVAHLKIQEKVLSPTLSAAKKAKEDVERKEAAKYIRSSSMPNSRRQMLLAAMNSSSSDSPSNKGTKHSPLIHKHSPKKRTVAASDHSSRKRLKVTCP